MGMRPCKECFTPVSDKATACPKCGAPVPKPTSRLTLLVGGLLIIGVGQALFPSSPRAPVEVTRTPEEQAAWELQDRLDREKRQEASRAAERVRRARQAVSAVRAHLRDPNSMEVAWLGTSYDAETICLKYRARNGFGGMNTGYATFLPGKSGDGDPKLFAQSCIGLIDITSQVN